MSFINIASQGSDVLSVQSSLETKCRRVRVNYNIMKGVFMDDIARLSTNPLTAGRLLHYLGRRGMVSP